MAIETRRPVTEETQTDDVPSHSGRVWYAVRVGGFFLLAETDDPEDLQVRLRDALRSDNRVVDATIARAPDRSPTTIRSVFPAARDAYTTDLITGRDQRPSLQFFTPLELTIRVPIKNQPNHTPFDEIASEEYFAVWDGWVLAIGWEQDSDDVPPAGGQVIAQILEQAAEACDAGLYIQACSPWCEHLFNHVTLLVESDPAATDSAIAPSTRFYQAILTWPGPITSAAEATWAAYREFLIPIQSFASMKNLGRRILDLERAARGELLGLMKLQYERAHASEHPLRERPVLLWQIRGWRRQSRASLARLWMTLTSIEELKREWSDTRVHFTDSLAGGGGSILFEGDEADETQAINSLDTSLIQRGIGEASARLDQSALLYATASTGIAALAGVLVGYFL